MKYLTITKEFNSSQILGHILFTPETYSLIKKHLETFIELNNKNIEFKQKIILKPSGILKNGKIKLHEIGLFIE